MNYLKACIKDGDVSYRGKYTEMFEKEICKITGSKYAVATNTGTSALYISLLLSGIGENDEVIVPCLSFVATANVVLYCNAKPIFIDIEPEFLTLNVDNLSKFLEKNAFSTPWGKTYNKDTGSEIKAIMPVHLFGRACNMDSIINIANRYNLKIIEDSCQALGSTYKDKHCGTIGDFGAISFNGNKIITTGGGGVILTQDEEMYCKAKHLVTVARVQSGIQWHDGLGYNFAMPSLNASYGLDNLKYLHKKLVNNFINYCNLYNCYSDRIVFSLTDTTCNFWRQIIKSESNYSNEIYLNSGWQHCYPLLPALPHLKNFQCDDLSIARELVDKIFIKE